MPLSGPAGSVGTSTLLGFYGTAPAAKTTGFVNTYSTADKTLNAYTPNVQSTPFSTAPGALTSAAQLSDLVLLQAAYENLRLFTEDLAQQYNSLIAVVKALGLIG